MNVLLGITVVIVFGIWLLKPILIAMIGLAMFDKAITSRKRGLPPPESDTLTPPPPPSPVTPRGCGRFLYLTLLPLLLHSIEQTLICNNPFLNPMRSTLPTQTLLPSQLLLLIGKAIIFSSEAKEIFKREPYGNLTVGGRDGIQSHLTGQYKIQRSLAGNIASNYPHVSNQLATDAAKQWLRSADPHTIRAQLKKISQLRVTIEQVSVAIDVATNFR